jgi:hypothetical protein
MDDLIDELKQRGGSCGFAVVEIPKNALMPAMGARVNPAALFRGLRLVVKGTTEHGGRRVIEVALFDEFVPERAEAPQGEA